MEYKDFEQEYFLEAYFAKVPKNIFLAEKTLQDIIDKLLKGPIDDNNVDYFRKKLKVFCDALCDQFGFDDQSDVVLSSQCGPASIQYWTRKGLYSQDNLNSIRKIVKIDMNKGEFKFNDKFKPWVKIYLNTNYLRVCKDAKIVMAAVLHEIGHTFEKQFRMLLNREQTVENIYQTLSRFNLLGAERKRLLLTSNMLYNVFGKVYVNLKDRVWKKETFADQFASMFGYGAFVAQSLKIIEDRANEYDAGTDTTRIEDMNFFDKALFELELKHNKTLKPSDKKKIQEDIKSIEKTIEKYLKDNDDDNYIIQRNKANTKKMYDKQRLDTTNNQVKGVDYYLDK